MAAANMQLVGLAIETSSSYGRDLVLGVMKYANLRRKWLMMEDFRGQLERESEWGRCAGLITTARPPDAMARLRAVVPHVVCCSGGVDDDPTLAIVCMDDAEVGRLAAQHFSECHIEHVAYYCLRGHRYLLAERRLEAFRRALAADGCGCAEFRPSKPVTYFPPNRQPQPHWPELIEWLRTLPRPVGILATDDGGARDLAAACHYANIPVPDHVAILGVNDDSLLCETAWPPLSSVSTDYVRVGYAAAELLDALLSGKALSDDERVTRLPPVGVHRRASTDILAVDDPDLAEAIRYVRDHACDPCTVEDVVRHVAVNRRRLERLCAVKLGRTVHEQIVHVRIARARQLLLHTDLDVAAVARNCGFSVTQFNRAFRSATEECPSDWRRARVRPAGLPEGL